MEHDAGATLEWVDRAPAGCGLVEVRGDGLSSEEIVRVVGESRRPLIVTVRRRDQGGGFEGQESERIRCLQAALAAGAAYVDVEWNSAAARELLAGEQGARVILSHHGVACDEASLTDLHRELARSPAALLKIVAVARRPADASAVRAFLARAGGAEPGRLACFALGRAGAITRVLAPSWGSWATYGASRSDRPTAEGQFTARDLLRVYDVLAIGADTRRYGLVGSHVFRSPSPAMHAAGYRACGLDARYIPVETDAVDEFYALVGQGSAAGFEAFAVTLPFKERVAARVSPGDNLTAASGAVNTVVARGDAWTGFNTDGPAALRLIEHRLALAGTDLAVAGAGGTARAIAWAAVQAGARVTLFNRSASRGARAAGAVGARFEALDRLPSARWDVLVNATPLGSGGETLLDPADLRGRLVFDAVYGPRPTPLCAAANSRGLETIDGFEFLVEQAVLQFSRMTGRLPDRQVLRDAGREWLDGAIPSETRNG